MANGSPPSIRRGALSVWDVTNGQRLRQWPEAHGHGALTFAPDGQKLAYLKQTRLVSGREGFDYSAWLLDVPTQVDPKARQRPPLHFDALLEASSPLVFSPDSRTLAAVAYGSGASCCCGAGRGSAAPQLLLS